MDLHPISRIATPEEVAGTVCFLAGPHAGRITGESIDVPVVSQSEHRSLDSRAIMQHMMLRETR